MSRRKGRVNITMVITEEKILSNIDKIQKMINPNSKKKIVQLEEDSYFKDLVEAIKTYLVEYPNKKNFPLNVYKATYGLVETATSQFEVTTKKIEELIKQREDNIVLSGELKDTLEAVDNKAEGWEEKINNISEKFSEDILEALHIVANAEDKESKDYEDAKKLLNARVNNLESNLHIEIDMERYEDVSKALSFIGIEIADALKLIPTPEEQIEAIAEQNMAEAKEEKTEKAKVQKTKEVKAEKKAEVKVEEKVETKVQENVAAIEEVQDEKEQYIEETTFEAKPSFWQKIKNSKFVRAATYLFRIKVRIELPNALPEGRGE